MIFQTSINPKTTRNWKLNQFDEYVRPLDREFDLFSCYAHVMYSMGDNAEQISFLNGINRELYLNFFPIEQ